jgi:hypothetical protein
MVEPQSLVESSLFHRAENRRSFGWGTSFFPKVESPKLGWKPPNSSAGGKLFPKVEAPKLRWKPPNSSAGGKLFPKVEAPEPRWKPPSFSRGSGAFRRREKCPLQNWASAPALSPRCKPSSPSGSPRTSVRGANFSPRWKPPSQGGSPRASVGGAAPSGAAKMPATKLGFSPGPPLAFYNPTPPDVLKKESASY